MSMIRDGIKLDFDDVLIVPRYSPNGSRSEIDLMRQYEFYHSPLKLRCIPIIAANMDTIGTLRMANVLTSCHMLTALSKHYDNIQLTPLFTTDNTKGHIFYTLGIRQNDITKFRTFLETVTPLMICIDVANGYSEYFVDKVHYIRELVPSAVIMAGNIATPEMVQPLIFAGADIVKIGL